MTYVIEIIRESWLVITQMSPYLLFGFLVAGILSVWVSPAWVERHLGRPGWGSVLKASLLGVPLPLCSCGVIPVSASIYRHGASRAATTAFLISTPQTGVDSIAITYGMLGHVFAIYRPIAALLTGLIGGGLVGLFGEPAAGAASARPDGAGCQAECCRPAAPGNFLLRALRYAFVTLPRDIGGALIVGVLIAGAISAFVDPGQWKAYLGSSIVSILLMMALGIPIYVCATASVPIAAGLIHMGASPGAALAFLVAGPATNAATIATVWRLLGRRTAVVYLLTVAGSAIVGGLLLDAVYSWVQKPVPHLDAHQHAAVHGGWLGQVWAVALLGIIILSSKTMARLIGGVRPMADKESPVPAGQMLRLKIDGMTCSHCAESVRRALAECDGVGSVEVDLAAGRARVSGDRLDRGQLIAAVAGLGYAASLPQEGST